MILRYSRSDGSTQPAEAESVELDDGGRLTGWRSVSDYAVGSFAGDLPAVEFSSLKVLIKAATEVPIPVGTPPPGSPSETLEVAGHQNVSPSGLEDGPWAELATAARALLIRLCDFPYAAVALEYSAGQAQLKQLGERGLTLDLSNLELKIACWHGYYESVDEYTQPIGGPKTVTAGPGWSDQLELPSTLPGSALPGSAPQQAPHAEKLTIHLSATFRIRAEDEAGNAVDGGTEVKVSYAPTISPED